MGRPSLANKTTLSSLPPSLRENTWANSSASRDSRFNRPKLAVATQEACMVSACCANDTVVVLLLLMQTSPFLLASFQQL